MTDRSAIARIAAFPDIAAELSAIVAGSQRATDAILATCEQLDHGLQDLPEACRARIRQATMQIFQACTMQDVTGQRVGRVGQLLRDATDGPEAAASRQAPSPTRPGGGLDQSAVDALLESAF